MEKKSQEFSITEALRLAKSPAGQQLQQFLQQADQETLNSAVLQAKQGNYEDAAKQIQALMSSPKAQALLKELEK